LFIPCDRLSWLPVSFLLNTHYHIIYQITEHQNGFVPVRSCLTNLLEAFQAWTHILDEGQNRRSPPNRDDVVRYWQTIYRWKGVAKWREPGPQSSDLLTFSIYMLFRQH